MNNKLVFLVVLLALMLSISSSIDSSALAGTDESRLAKKEFPSKYWNRKELTVISANKSDNTLLNNHSRRKNEKQ